MAAKKKLDGMQDFTAIFSVVTGDGAFAAGETVSLTREDYDVLKALGAIEGEWDEKAASETK
ncbi:MAG: hypothetical protein QM651_18120 [Rhodoblastus sp.]